MCVCVAQVSPPAAIKLADSHTVSELSDLGDAVQLMYDFPITEAEHYFAERDPEPAERDPEP